MKYNYSMIYNLLFKTGVKYKDVEKYSNIFMLIISIFTTINCFFDYDYEVTTNILKYYLFGEMIILPFNKLDMILHHISSISLLQYIKIYDIDMVNNYYSTKQLLLTETSTIFLSLNSVLKLFRNGENVKLISACQQVSLIFFIVTFMKTRLYDFYFNILINDYYMESINKDNILAQRIYVNSFTYILFCLNVYWFTLIIKKVYKESCKKNAD